MVKGRLKEVRARLSVLLSDDNPTVVLNAIEALGARGEAIVQHRMRELLKSSSKLSVALGLYMFHGKSDEETMSLVGGLVLSRDPDLRECAESAFLRNYVDTERLFRDRQNYPGRIRKLLVDILGRSAQAVPHIHALLSDSDDETRAAALLRRTENDRQSVVSEAELRALLNDSFGGVRAPALQALYHLKPKDILDLVQTGCQDKSNEVRSTALWCAGWLQDPVLTDAVVGAVTQGCDSFMACWYFSAPENDRLVSGWIASSNVHIRRMMALSVTDEGIGRLYTRLLGLARDSDPEVMRYLVYDLAKDKSPRAVADIAEIAKRCVGETLAEALDAMSATGQPSAISFLSTYLSNSDKEVALAAKRAIKNLSDRLPPPGLPARRL